MLDLAQVLCAGWWFPGLMGLIIRVVESLQSGGRIPMLPVARPALNPLYLFAPGAAGGLLNAAATALISDLTKGVPLIVLAPAIAGGLPLSAFGGVLMGALFAVLGQAAFAFPGRPPSPLFQAVCSLLGGAVCGQLLMTFLLSLIRLVTQ